MTALAARPCLKIFDIGLDFGIDKTKFLNYLRPTFSILHLDPYDAKRSKVEFLKKRFPEHSARLNDFLSHYYAGREDLDAVFDLIGRLDPMDLREFDRIGMTGRRKRAIARFILSKDPRGWHIRRTGAPKFVQKVGSGDVRALERIFAEATETVTDFPPIQTLMRHFADMVVEQRPDAQVLQMNLHQMFTFADRMGAGENAPEGIHQDGADYIVSALVIERAGITGGESVVYDSDKKKLLRHTLAEGEGIFQDDRNLWHYVTPIQEDPAVPPDYGHRSILGFDIDIFN